MERRERCVVVRYRRGEQGNDDEEEEEKGDEGELCPYCGFEFESRGFLGEHIQNAHGTDRYAVSLNVKGMNYIHFILFWITHPTG